MRRPGPATVARAALLAAAIALALPAGAGAAVVAIDSAPLDILVADDGRLQVRQDGAADGELFPPDDDEADAGLNLGTGVGGQSPELWGYLGQAPQPVSQGAVVGDGSPAAPFEQVTTYRLHPAGASPLTIVQTVSYVAGERSFRARYAISADSGTGALDVRPILAADLFAGGDGTGAGFLEAGPPRAVGARNTLNAATVAIVEATPWAHFEEDHHYEIDDHVQDLSPSGGLDDSVQPDPRDSGIAVQWPDTELCAASPACR